MVRVRVAASPPLLGELVRKVLAGDGIDLTETSDCLVTVVTPEHLGEAHSRVVLVLGNSSDGDVEIIVDEQHSAPSALRSEQLRDLVLEMGRRVSPDPANPSER